MAVSKRRKKKTKKKRVYLECRNCEKPIDLSHKGYCSSSCRETYLAIERYAKILKAKGLI